MSIYAHLQNGVVIEIIYPLLDDSGNEYAINVRYPQDFVAQCVDITGISPQPDQHWLFDGSNFSPPPGPSIAQLLAAAKDNQTAIIYDAYNAASTLPVSYTSKGGLSAIFDADSVSQSRLCSMLAGFTEAQAAPADFYWVANDNSQIPFTFPDILGLAAALAAQGWVAFQKLQILKSAIRAATTPESVNAISW